MNFGKEKNFETAVEEGLTKAGWNLRRSENYTTSLSLDKEQVISFIITTQPKSWQRLKEQYSDQVEKRFLERLSQEIYRRGILDVLKKGVKDRGIKVELAFFKPASGLNPDTEHLYKANSFNVMRQVFFSESTQQSIDLVLFLNGLPIITAELKSRLNGQDVQDAIQQYRKDRSSKEPLFQFGRCLAHFAVDNELAYMTTHLEGFKTRFLPFNQGYCNGAGNPPSATDHPVRYLWEDVWHPDSILELIQNYCADFKQERKDRKPVRKIIFPRYHQRAAVRKLIQHARSHGTGHRYLIQHSAGSGKSNTIAWLADQLAHLHNEANESVFDSVIVITDRRVLDRQLQITLGNIITVDKLVENIDKGSAKLKEALEKGRRIIVTTLQKFPVIYQQVQDLPGTRFAVIVDEAHSSQSGESARQMKATLSNEEEEENAPEDLEDKINADIEKRGQKKNLSLFAFTATPKAKTLELFGFKNEKGQFIPFHLYPMRQAIEEKFILDVLTNYTTYQTYWNLLKKVETDPHVDKKKGEYLLKQFVEHHRQTVKRKARIMLEHFSQHVMHEIDSEAKGMIVARSRLQAIRYKLAVDEIIEERKYPFKSLVAFSSEVRDQDTDKTYTESSMNAGLKESQTAETFNDPTFRIMIVANKFQTGFDQPLLTAMYVDRRLDGVQAVQTLSRLNRTCPNKNNTFVLDFVNEAAHIQSAFDPFYEKTLLEEGTDPNLLYDKQRQLEEHEVFTLEDIDQFARVYWSTDRIEKKQPKLRAALRPVVDRVRTKPSTERLDFRGLLDSYVRLYAFLSQVITFKDADLEKLYWFAKALARELPEKGERLPTEIQDAVDMESYAVRETFAGKIEPEGGNGVLKPRTYNEKKSAAEKTSEPISHIIEGLNERFGTDFTSEDMMPAVRTMMDKLDANEALAKSMANSPEDAFKESFDIFLGRILQDLVETHFRFYQKVNDDERMGNHFRSELFNWYCQRKNGKNGQKDLST